MRTMREIADALALEKYPPRWDALAEHVRAGTLPEDDSFLTQSWIREAAGFAVPLGGMLDSVLEGAAAIRENAVLRDWTVLLALAMRDRTAFNAERRMLVLPKAPAGTPPLAYEMAPCLGLMTQAAPSVERMRSRGVPEDIIGPTLRNTLDCLEVFQLRYGRPGMDMHYFGWSQGFADGRILQIGSLQFEAAARFGHTVALPDRTIGPDDPVIHVHIPMGADIGHEARHAAYGRTRTIFAKSFPEYRFRAFACHSWLMDPTLAALLPDSRIAAFQGEFIRLPDRRKGGAVYEYVFIGDWPTLESLPENTRLERALKKWYLQGNTIDEMLGVMPF